MAFAYTFPFEGELKLEQLHQRLTMLFQALQYTFPFEGN